MDIGDSEPYALGPGETQPFSVDLFNEIPYARMAIVGDSSTPGALPITLNIPRGGFPPMYGSTVQLTGSAAPGAAVTIQRWDISGSWIALAHGVADGAGRFATTAKITTTWFVRAVTDQGQSVGVASMQRAKITFAPSTSSIRKGSTVTFQWNGATGRARGEGHDRTDQGDQLDDDRHGDADLVVRLHVPVEGEVHRDVLVQGKDRHPVGFHREHVGRAQGYRAALTRGADQTRRRPSRQPTAKRLHGVPLASGG